MSAHVYHNNTLGLTKQLKVNSGNGIEDADLLQKVEEELTKAKGGWGRHES